MCLSSARESETGHAVGLPTDICGAGSGRFRVNAPKLGGGKFRRVTAHSWRGQAGGDMK